MQAKLVRNLYDNSSRTSQALLLTYASPRVWRCELCVIRRRHLLSNGTHAITHHPHTRHARTARQAEKKLVLLLEDTRCGTSTLWIEASISRLERARRDVTRCLLCATTLQWTHRTHSTTRWYRLGHERHISKNDYGEYGRPGRIDTDCRDCSPSSLAGLSATAIAIVAVCAAVCALRSTIIAQ